jgi:hypothetical protein
MSVEVALTWVSGRLEGVKVNGRTFVPYERLAKAWGEAARLREQVALAGKREHEAGHRRT